MSNIVWQVRKAGKYYNMMGMSEDTTKYSALPFDEYIGDNLPADFEGEVIRRVKFDYDRGPDGYVPHMTQKAYTEMYPGAGGQ